ncbi:U-box domain-containing protein 45 [Amborella trichopoda]|nr:U-box domain-containing protein 45 [Amborella trichopoda]XP_020523357.1 U-box domain-containing protein 45 [Amborella trichopoda]|eukprot:XP_006845220.2 U-box domain-containing protein 45 [Amborella trichopoda]
MGMMDTAEVEESLFAVSDAKLHGEMCKKLSEFVCKVMAIFPALEASRPRCKSGLQALCSLHVALEKSKNLLQHCSDCSKLYLAITSDSVLLKFEKARCALEQSLRRVEDIVPQAIGCQILEIVSKLEATVFSLDPSEKQVGDDVIQLLQQDLHCNSNCNDVAELEAFHQAASKLGITSSTAALAERRALKRLIERAHREDDKRKESIVSYLLHLMRKYSKIFRSSEYSDDGDSQGSAPCSPTVQSSIEEVGGCGRIFDRQISKLSSFNSKSNCRRSGNIPVPPEEFRCPISLQLMYDPVIISSGQTYERVCIEKWFDDGHDTCPKTQQKLSHLSLTPNYCVKGLIASWCEQNGMSVPDRPPESLDFSYWSWVLSQCKSTNSRSIGSIDTGRLKGIKVVPFEEIEVVSDGKVPAVLGVAKDSCDSKVAPVDREENMTANLDDSGLSNDADGFVMYERLMSELNDETDMDGRRRAAEQIRFLVKDDEERRSCMGANGFIEALVRFLKVAIEGANDKAQETGALALFNLTVNNNRNKRTTLSAVVLPLLQEMLQGKAYEAAVALYLSLSSLDQGNTAIASTPAVQFLVCLLLSSGTPPMSTQCKLDAIHTLYILSTLPVNAPHLLSASLIPALARLLIDQTFQTEMCVTIFANLAANENARREMVSTAGLIGALALVLETGEVGERVQAASCLLALCEGDERCGKMVLSEGVIPALVSLSASGTPRGKDKAQKLLLHFRQWRQRELPSPPPQQQPPLPESGLQGGEQLARSKREGGDGSKPLCKSSSRRLGRTLSSMWRSKTFSVYQC